MQGLDLKDLARRGAIARLAELQAEATAILKAFPELKRGAAIVANTDDGTTILPGRNSRRRRGRPPMSAAQRKAVSVRMKRYWAARRKSKHA